MLRVSYDLLSLDAKTFLVETALQFGVTSFQQANLESIYIDESLVLLVGLSRVADTLAFPEQFFEAIATRVVYEEFEIAKYFILMHEILLRN